ncbi:MAG: phosphoenolpyruvate--protein phosphotransferase, partial [Bacilli bacterium]|nr:phosphoenolpyruvate--protein phosphotransferase [Bacilli bacterium]
ALLAELGKKQVSSKNAEIQETVKSVLEDEAFAARIEAKIKNDSLNAACAVKKAAEELAGSMNEVDSEYIRSRQDDIRGIAEKLVSILLGADQTPSERSAICAFEMSPAQLSSIDESLIGCILTDKGSPNSHVAILAGNINIPYLYGNNEAIEEMQKAKFVIVDSDTGTVTTDPDKKAKEAALARMEEVNKQRQKEEEAQRNNEEAPACKTKIYANIAGPKDIEELVKSGADGVGLFRTEFLFLDKDVAPTEDEQFEAYKAVLEAMGEKEVIIRTMDIGSDKKVSWLKLPDEFNPALGLRGARVSLEDHDLFLSQLRALLRAGVSGNLKVMFPMFASEWETDEIKERINEAAAQLEKEGIPYKMPKLGIMVETPAAAVCSEELAKKVSFFSIGTNDLTQYTLALDRESQGLDRYFNPHHEAVFKLIGMTAQNGHKHNVETGVCGQLGADPEAVKRLIELGVDELSVPVRKVKATKILAFEAEKQLEEEKTNGGNSSMPSVSAVADGKLIPMSDIPDPVFSEGTMGECFAILPDNGNVYAPFSGTIVAIAETGHAVTIQSDEGFNVLVHVGIDTVKLGQKAFKHHIKQGDHVEANQLIMEADLKMIKEAGLSTMIIVIALS